MFNFVSKRKRVIQVLLALVTIPFAFFGLQSYTEALRGSDDVAKVDGTGITQREFTQTLERQQERLRAVLGAGVDPAAFDTPATRRALLESLISQHLVATQAVKANMTVSDDVLRETIASMPVFQSDGHFSKSAYDMLLKAQGITPKAFEASTRFDLAVGQLTRSIVDSAIYSRSVAARLAELQNQKREVSQALVAAKPFLAQVKVDDAEVKRYYDSHQAEFRVPEQMRAEYVVLSADDLGKTETITDAELHAAYEAHKSRYMTPEQRRASHILIAVPAGAKESVREAARKKAEKILAELRKSPGSFAELAKKYSQDPGSADKGGDLGFFGRGMMTKPFEDAVFGLKVGEISGLVETEFGYHIIELTAIDPAKGKSFDEVRPELLAQLRREKGSRKFAEAADTFNNMVYEQPDSLKPVAARFGLQVQTSGWFTKAGGAAAGILNKPKLLNELFSADAIRDKHNTDAVEVSPNVLVSARVAEHRPARERTFDEAKGDIRTELQRREAARLAAKAGAAKLAELEKGAQPELTWEAAKLVSRRDAQGLPPEVLQRVMSIDASKLPAYAGAEAGDAGYVIYRLSKIVNPPPASDKQKAAEVAQIERQSGLSQYEAYVASLRAVADITVNEKNLERK